MLGKNKTSLGVFAFAAVLCSLLFAPGCGDDDKDKVDGQTPATPATTDVCTKGATKCGDGANAHILYTCKDGTAYDSGTDCTANDSHKICGGDAVKACVCDAAKGYVESSGTCACGTVNGIEYVDKNGFIYIYGFKYSAVSHGSFIMVDYETNPLKDKLLEAFNNF